MLNLNRRHTEALEKTARAKKRLADAEETIARHLGDYLRDEDAEEEKHTVDIKKSTTPKNPPPKK